MGIYNVQSYQMLDSNTCGPNIWDYFQKEPVMSGQEIADEMKMTRANVSRILKKIFAQTYYLKKNEYPEKTPFDLAVLMSNIFGLDFSMDMEVKKFFSLFPMELKELIKKDGQSRMEAGQKRILSTVL